MNWLSYFSHFAKSLRGFRHRYIIGFLVSSLLLCGFSVLRIASAQSPTTKSSVRGVVVRQEARVRLAEMKARGDRTIKLVALAKEGESEAVANAIRRAGGTIKLRVDSLGYVRAHLPVDSVEALVSTAPIVNASVGKVLASEALTSDGWKTRAVTAGARGANPNQAIPQIPVERTDWNEDPLRRPYDPNNENGVRTLRRKHPTYDGRGVTIAQVEWDIDLLSPELGDSPALTLEGRPTRKVLDIVTSRDPSDPSPTVCCITTPWVAMEEHVVATQGRFIVGHISYQAPYDGSFRFGAYEGGFLCRRVDPRRAEIGDEMFVKPLSEPCGFSVLWDTTRGDVWLDTNRDNDFSREKAMRDYRQRFDVPSPIPYPGGKWYNPW